MITFRKRKCVAANFECLTRLLIGIMLLNPLLLGIASRADRITPSLPAENVVRIMPAFGAAFLVDQQTGVAIRHAAFRLNQQPSASRLLITLSDARPAGEAYDQLYAREDTRVALAEARASGISNFFIIFDQGQHKAETERMLENTNFTIIDDILRLPERMPAIYRRLTT